MRATKKLLCSLTFFLLGSLLVTAQQRTLTGKVQNKQGVGIAGAIISVVNSAKRTVTDNAGSFSIVVSASETQLSVTSF
ncbi:hypothetical protein ABTE87_20975, partial [Acinetobacter baumannii]